MNMATGSADPSDDAEASGELGFIKSLLGSSGENGQPTSSKSKLGSDGLPQEQFFGRMRFKRVETKIVKAEPEKDKAGLDIDERVNRDLVEEQANSPTIVTKKPPEKKFRRPRSATKSATKPKSEETAESVSGQDKTMTEGNVTTHEKNKTGKKRRKKTVETKTLNNATKIGSPHFPRKDFHSDSIRGKMHELQELLDNKKSENERANEELIQYTKDSSGTKTSHSETGSRKTRKLKKNKIEPSVSVRKEDTKENKMPPREAPQEEPQSTHDWDDFFEESPQMTSTVQSNSGQSESILDSTKDSTQKRVQFTDETRASTGYSSDSDWQSDSADKKDTSARGKSPRGSSKVKQEPIRVVVRSRPGSVQPSSGRPSSGRPSSGRPSSGRPSSGRPSSGRPSSGRLVAEGSKVSIQRPTMSSSAQFQHSTTHEQTTDSEGASDIELPVKTRPYTPTDCQLRNIANSEILDWLQEKNRLFRKKHKEERRKRQEEKRKEEAKKKEKEEKLEESHKLVKQWMKKKKKEKKEELRLLRRKQQKKDNTMQNQSLSAGEQSGPEDARDGETRSVSDLQVKAVHKHSRRSSARSSTSISTPHPDSCTCGFVEFQKQKDEELKRAQLAAQLRVVEAEREKQKETVRKALKMKTCTVHFTGSGSEQENQNLPKLAKAGRSRSMEMKEQNSDANKPRLSYDNWLKNKKIEHRHKEAAAKKEEEMLANSLDEETKSAISRVARKRIDNILNKQKRIDTGLRDVDEEANMSVEDRIQQKKNLRKKKLVNAENLAISDGNPETATDSQDNSINGVKPFQWRLPAQGAGCRPASARPSSTQKEVSQRRPMSASNSSKVPNRADQIHANHPNPYVLPHPPTAKKEGQGTPKPTVKRTSAYKRVKYQQKSWDSFADKMFDDVVDQAEKDYGSIRPEPMGSDQTNDVPETKPQSATVQAQDEARSSIAKHGEIFDEKSKTDPGLFGTLVREKPIILRDSTSPRGGEDDNDAPAAMAVYITQRAVSPAAADDVTEEIEESLEEGGVEDPGFESVEKQQNDTNGYQPADEAKKEQESNDILDFIKNIHPPKSSESPRRSRSGDESRGSSASSSSDEKAHTPSGRVSISREESVEDISHQMADDDSASNKDTRSGKSVRFSEEVQTEIYIKESTDEDITPSGSSERIRQALDLDGLEDGHQPEAISDLMSSLMQNAYSNMEQIAPNSDDDF